LSAFTDAISRLFTIWPVVVVRRAWSSSSGIAVISPKAVQFMASAMLAASRAAFSAGLAVATAAKAVIRPMMVPSSPNRVAIFESSARYGVRFSNWGTMSIMLSSMAISMSSRRLTAPWRANPIDSICEMAESSSLIISRALSKSPSASTGCTSSHILRFPSLTRFR